MRHFYLWRKTVFPVFLLVLFGMLSIKANTISNIDDIIFATPVAENDVFSTEENTPVSGDLLLNDLDPDGGNLNMIVVPFPAPVNGSVFLTTSGTFTYTPNTGFTGIEQFGYRVCDANNNCIEATATIYVWPADCTPIEETYAESSCDSCTQICLDIALLDLQSNYTLTQNGQPFYGIPEGCEFESIQAYTYFNLLGQGNAGPYELITWEIDGSNNIGQFDDPQALVDLMNAADPNGNWFLNESQFLIMGGTNTSTYGNMTVENLLNNSFVDLTFNTQTIAKGTLVCLEPGMHELAFNPLDGSCPDRVAIVDITCVNTNNPPIAVDDNYTVDEGEIFMNNIIINDNEPDGDPTIAAIVTMPSNGTIMLNVNGGFTYVPNAGFIGVDNFVYELCDDQGLCDQATVTLNVIEVNDPPIAVNDTYTIQIGETIDDNVITNDSDPEGGLLTVTTTTVSGPQMGIVTLNADGSFTYLSPPNFEGVDQFVYELCDDANNCVEGTVTINIQASNNAPVAMDDNYTTSEDVPVMENVIDNDTDESTADLVATLLSQPANGAVTLNADGSFSYMPFAGYIGSDQFDYEICDLQGECDQATVFINVEIDCGNEVETFTSESCDSCVYVCLSIPFDDIDGYGISVDGIDFSGDVLACEFDTIIAYTYFTLLGQGEEGPYELLSWTIDGNTYTGMFNNPIELMDLMNTINPEGNWQMLPGSTIIFGGVDASDYSVMMVQNLAAEFSFSEIGFNEGEVANGTAICVTQGTENIQATLLGEICPTVEVDVAISCAGNDPPVAVDDSFTTMMDVFINNTVLTNDSDSNGDALTVNTTLISEPTNGTILIGNTGVFNYIPNAGFIGQDMFTYEVCDGSGLCDQAVVTIDVLPIPCTSAEVDDVAVVNSSCGGSDGQITVSVLGNLSDYTFTWSTNTGTTSTEGNELSGISQGTYSVTITNIDDVTCETIQNDIVVGEGSIEVADIIITPSVCEQDNGSVELLPSTYIYNWVDGTISNSRNDLAAGTYTVSVTDVAQPTCEVEIEVVITDEAGLQVSSEIVSQPYCGFPSGEVNILASDGSGNYTYVWEDGNTSATRNDLLAGGYDVTVTDTDSGCEIIANILLEDDGNCNDTIFITMPQALPMDTCLTALYDLGGTLSNAGVCHDDAITVLLEVNADDACVNLDPNDDFVGTDTLCVFHCNELGFCDTTTIIVEIESTCSNDFLGMDDELVVSADSCEGTARLCLPIPFGEFQNYEVSDNGLITTAGIAGCNFDTIITYNYFTLVGDGEFGPYILDSWAVDGQMFSGEFQTISDLVDSMNVWNPMAEWELNATAELIVGVNGGTDYSDMLITHPLTNSNFDIGFNIGEYSNGTYLELEIGTHEVIVTNIIDGCIDTLQVEVFCLEDQILYDTILLSVNDSTCYSIPSNLPGSVALDNLMNMCTDDGGTEVTFNPASSNGTEICVNYTGIEIGTDTTCVTVCDDLGFCQTTTIIVTVLPSELSPVVDTIYVGDIEVACTDDFNYVGMFDTATNGCEELGGESLIFDIDEASGCITYSALEIGTDTACVVYCDTVAMTCDTAYLYVHVLDTTNVISPIATDDIDSTLQGLPIMVDVVSNDIINGNLQTIIITDNPGSGTVMVSGDTMVLYTPSQNFCGQDSFQYMICNETSCDTATVVIDVECTDFHIYTAMSPNGDGVNDNFVIQGVEQFDEVSVTVFNRWGNKVFERRNERYTNQFNDEGKGPWNGTWNGKELPDGTYFYCIELPDGLGNRTGYLQIQR